MLPLTGILRAISPRGFTASFWRDELAFAAIALASSVTSSGRKSRNAITVSAVSK